MIPIQVYFRNEKLGQHIKTLAKENSRTLSNQIQFICKEYFALKENKTPKAKQ